MLFFSSIRVVSFGFATWGLGLGLASWGLGLGLGLDSW